MQRELASRSGGSEISVWVVKGTGGILAGKAGAVNWPGRARTRKRLRRAVAVGKPAGMRYDGSPPQLTLEERKPVKRNLRIAAVVLIALAVVVFLFGAARIGFMVARATIGLYEALFIAAIGVVLLLSSRLRS